jgi:hypothetical protein
MKAIRQIRSSLIAAVSICTPLLVPAAIHAQSDRVSADSSRAAVRDSLSATAAQSPENVPPASCPPPFVKGMIVSAPHNSPAVNRWIAVHLQEFERSVSEFLAAEGRSCTPPVGRLDFFFTIQPDGAVMGFENTRSSIEDPSARKDICERFQQFRFPATATDISANRVRYRMTIDNELSAAEKKTSVATRGSFEIGGSVIVLKDNSAPSIGVSALYYPHPNVFLGAELTGGVISEGWFSTAWYTIGARLGVIVWDKSVVVPYLGTGFDYIGPFGNAFGIPLYGGLKCKVSRNVFINVQPTFTPVIFDGYTDAMAGINVGISGRFGNNRH